MALFDRKAEREEDLVCRNRRRLARALGDCRRERFRRGRVRQARQGVRPHLRPDAASGPTTGHPAHGHHRSGPRARGRRRHRHQPVAVSPRRRRSPASTSPRPCSRRRGSAPPARTCRYSLRLLQMDAADLKFADDSFDIVYAPVPDQRRSRPDQGRAGDAPGLPPGRPDCLPQPLPAARTRSCRGSSGRFHR